MFPRTHNPAFRPKAATPTGRRPITSAVSGCSPQPMFRALQIPDLFPSYPRIHNPHFDRRLLSLWEDGQSLALVSGCSPRSMFHGIQFPGFSLWLSPEPTTPCFSRKSPPLQGDDQSRHWFFVSVPDRFSAVSGSPAFPESTTPHFDRRPPLLRGDGQSLARFPVPSHPKTHNPAFRPEAATPTGRRPTLGTAFPVLTRPFPDLAIPPAMPRGRGAFENGA